ncbi:unnamed protein product [Cylicostephanus goldi]|uniref:Uncharacterized protein n=1 Tax=Cylicostephanus goldi TaxID=71465 RepID=A0A3P6SD37_CYLGO|nr:unnamed protein product [Cylicostephanus goldi]
MLVFSCPLPAHFFVCLRFRCYTLQFPVLIDGKIYESGDHYYQIQKVHDLCGTVSDKLTETVRDEKGRRLDGKVGFSEHRDKSFSQIAKDVIRLNNVGVDKKKVDEWRYSRGLEVMQKALLAKVCFHASFIDGSQFHCHSL